MPHTIVEHSLPIFKPQIDKLLLKLNQKIALSEGNFDISQCKARAVFCENFVIADNSKPQDFLHITTKIMAGRSLENRKKLAENLLLVAGDFLKEQKLSQHPIALSVDIAQMDKEIYQKTLIS
jgi:5-carboxymethyl-2-hydroxymuconate isomerase